MGKCNNKEIQMANKFIKIFIITRIKLKIKTMTYQIRKKYVDTISPVLALD